MAKKKVKQAEDHRLVLVAHSPIHAVCECGGWRYKADMEFGSAIDAIQYVDRWFQSHRRIERRRAA